MDRQDGNLMTLLGIDGLADDKKMAILDMATTLVEKRILARVIGQLDAESVQTAQSLKGAEQADFIAKRVPDYARIMNEEIAAVREELAAFAKSE